MSAIGIDMLHIPSVGLCLCLCLESILCKTAEWIRMPFGVVSGVGRGMGVLNEGGVR